MNAEYLFPEEKIRSVQHANDIWTKVGNQRKKPTVRQKVLAKLFFDTGGLKGKIGKVTGYDEGILLQSRSHYRILHPSDSDKVSHKARELRHAMHYANTGEEISMTDAASISPDSKKYVFMFPKDESKSNYY